MASHVLSKDFFGKLIKLLKKFVISVYVAIVIFLKKIKKLKKNTIP